MRIKFIGAMAAVLLLAAPAMGMYAGNSFVYQGRLLDDKGHVLPASQRKKTIEFRFYTQLSGGDVLGTITREVFLSEDGQFSVSVGDPLLDDFLLEHSLDTLYIGLTVQGDGAEMAPRQKLMTVPSAICAGNSTTAKGNMTVGNQCSSARLSVTQSVSAGSLSTAGQLESSTLGAGAMNASNVAVDGVVDGKGVIPVGGIVFWSGAVNQIPSGWALCDGQRVNGITTPNLRDRFVVGAGGSSGYGLGNTGGEATHKLTEAEMPKHRHQYKFTGADLNQSWKNSNFFYCQHNQYPNNTNTKWTEYTGGDQPHENRPPYYALCYIMRVR